MSAPVVERAKTTTDEASQNKVVGTNGEGNIITKLLKTKEQKKDANAPVQAVENKSDEDEEKKKKKREEEQGGGAFLKLFKKLFHTKPEKIDAQLQQKTKDFTSLVKVGFSGVTEEQFAQLVVIWDGEEKKIANRAISAVYKAARDKGISSETLDNVVERVRLQKKDQTQLVQDTTKVVSIDNYAKEKFDAARESAEKTHSRKDIAESIASTLVHVSPDNPLYAKAEVLISQLQDDSFTASPQELQELLVNWKYAQQQVSSVQQKELVASAQEGILAIAREAEVDVEDLQRQAIAQAVKGEQKESDENPLTDLKVVRKFEQRDSDETRDIQEEQGKVLDFLGRNKKDTELELVEPQDRFVVAARTKPIHADGQPKEEVEIETMGAVDRALRQKRNEGERLQFVDEELRDFVGTKKDMDGMRIIKAASSLGVDLQNVDREEFIKFARAILKAHKIGEGEDGADGSPDATLGNYTIGQIRRKYETVLEPVAHLLGLDPQKDGQILKEEIGKLMDKGIIGRGPGGAVLDRPQAQRPLEEVFTEENTLHAPTLSPEEIFARWEPYLRDITPNERARIMRHVMSNKLLPIEAPQANIGGGNRGQDTVDPGLAALSDEELERHVNELRRRRRERQANVPPEEGELDEPLDPHQQLTDDQEAYATREGATIGDIQANEDEQARIYDITHGEGAAAQRRAAHDAWRRNYDPETAREVAQWNRRNPERQLDIQPKNFRDVLKLIAFSDPDKWGVNGEHPVIDEHGNIIEKNFIRWFFDRIEFEHDNDPDSPLNFFQQLSITLPEMWRDVNVGNMLRTKKLFRYVPGPNEIDPRTGQHYEVDPSTGKPKEIELNDLFNYVTNAVWLIGFIRNAEVGFRQEVMLNEDKAPEALARLYSSNALVKKALGGKTSMEWFMTMSRDFKDYRGNENAEENDMEMGQMLQESMLIYYNITDYNLLKEQYGHLEYFITKKGVDRAIRMATLASLKKDHRNRYMKLENVTQDHIDVFLKDGEMKDIMSLFGADGKLIEDRDKEHNEREKVIKFLKILNPFEPYQKNQNQLGFTRQLIQQAIAEQIGLLDKNTGELKDPMITSFAELLGYWTQYPFGGAQRNGIGQEAINVFEKSDRIRQYKGKMFDYERLGKGGKIFNFTFLKSSISDYLNGFKSVHGRTIMEDLMGMHQVRTRRTENDEQRRANAAEQREIAREMQYRRNDQRQFADVGIKNGFIVSHNEFYAEFLNFKEWAQYDAYGGVRIDTAKMQKDLIDKWITPTRYAFNLGMDMDIVERELEDKYSMERRWSTKADKTFNAEVLLLAQKILAHESKTRNTSHKRKLADFNEKLAKNELTLDFLDANGRVKINQADGSLDPKIKALLKHKEFNRVVQKAYLLCNFSASLYASTNHYTNSPHLEFGEREVIIRALSKLAVELETDPDDKDFKKTKVVDNYFTAFDIEILREKSDNIFWKSFVAALAADGLAGAFEGLGKGLGQTLKQIFA